MESKVFRGTKMMIVNFVAPSRDSAFGSVRRVMRICLADGIAISGFKRNEMLIGDSRSSVELGVITNVYV